MNALLVAAGIAVPVFASTNIDDIFVLLAFFSDAAFKGRQIVIGQFLGIGSLILVSLICSLEVRPKSRSFVKIEENALAFLPQKQSEAPLRAS